MTHLYRFTVTLGAIVSLTGCVTTNATRLGSKGESSWTDEAAMFRSMRKKAAELGANAIILDAVSEPSAGARVASSSMRLHSPTCSAAPRRVFMDDASQRAQCSIHRFGIGEDRRNVGVQCDRFRAATVSIGESISLHAAEIVFGQDIISAHACGARLPGLPRPRDTPLHSRCALGA